MVLSSTSALGAENMFFFQLRSQAIQRAPEPSRRRPAREYGNAALPAEDLRNLLDPPTLELNLIGDESAIFHWLVQHDDLATARCPHRPYSKFSQTT